jgi:hypothetical protein
LCAISRRSIAVSTWLVMVFNSSGLGAADGVAALTCRVGNGSSGTAGRPATPEGSALAADLGSTFSTTLTRASVRVVVSVRSRKCFATVGEIGFGGDADTAWRWCLGGVGLLGATIVAACDLRSDIRPPVTAPAGGAGSRWRCSATVIASWARVWV